MTAYQVLLNWGEVHVEAGTASLLIAIAPVFSVLLGNLFLGERLTRTIVVGSVVALAGAAVVSLAEGTSGFSLWPSSTRRPPWSKGSTTSRASPCCATTPVWRSPPTRWSRVRSSRCP